MPASEIAHLPWGGRALVDEIAQLFMNEEISRVCILGPGEMGKTSIPLTVIEFSPVKERFPSRNCIWVPCIGATSERTFLEILYVHLQGTQRQTGHLTRSSSSSTPRMSPATISRLYGMCLAKHKSRPLSTGHAEPCRDLRHDTWNTPAV